LWLFGRWLDLVRLHLYSVALTHNIKHSDNTRDSSSTRSDSSTRNDSIARNDSTNNHACIRRAS